MIPQFKNTVRKSLRMGALAWTLAAGMSADRGFSDNVREYDENGLRYRETTRIVQRPVYETKMVEQTREVVQPTYTTDQVPTTRTVYVPITEYKPQPVMRGRWNPFIEPYYEYRFVPVTRWETKQETVNVPVVRQQNKTETHTVKVPVTTMRLANEEYVRREIIGRALGDVPAGGPAAGGAAASTASRSGIGGISLKDPPPR
jgi:hypothetical protein